MKGDKLGQSSLIVKKYSGSHRKLRPVGAEYKSNDGLLKNMAAHSGFPYKKDEIVTYSPGVISTVICTDLL